MDIQYVHDNPCRVDSAEWNATLATLSPWWTSAPGRIRKARLSVGVTSGSHPIGLTGLQLAPPSVLSLCPKPIEVFASQEGKQFQEQKGDKVAIRKLRPIIIAISCKIRSISETLKM
eukprot:gb/GECG01015899.1/.p1 GENE.gb/GECG01015899.1/~~gb/GECG01015899.1/.p1  ORF type:complete len:117 (+),score=4.97 gb/GECG01015899.1/:1-351(+)